MFRGRQEKHRLNIGIPGHFLQMIWPSQSGTLVILDSPPEYEFELPSKMIRDVGDLGWKATTENDVSSFITWAVIAFRNWSDHVSTIP